MAGQPENQQASTPANRPPHMAARGSSEAPDTGRPGMGPGGPTPDADHAEGLPQPTTNGAQSAGHAGAAPSAAPAHRSDAGAQRDAASRVAPPRGPFGAHAQSEARTTTPNMPKRRNRQGNVARRAHPRRRLFQRLHGVLQECPTQGSNTGCTARPSRATRRP